MAERWVHSEYLCVISRSDRDFGISGINSPSWYTYLTGLKYFNRMTKALWYRTVSFRLCATVFGHPKFVQNYSVLEKTYILCFICTSVLEFAAETPSGQGSRFFHFY